MNIVFFIRSRTVNIENYTIKNIPGSSGRLDVISRAILAALINNNELEDKIKIGVLLDNNYGVYFFDSGKFSSDSFPLNEISLTDYFVKFIRNKGNSELLEDNPLNSIEFVETEIFSEIKRYIRKKYKVYVLDEMGEPFQQEFKNLTIDDNLLFIVGDQSGDLLASEELKKMNIINISLGKQSYLASSVIRLIKLNLQLIVG